MNDACVVPGCSKRTPDNLVTGARHLNNDNGIFDAMLVDGLPITAAANAFVRRFVLFFEVLTSVIIVTAFLERNVLQTFSKKAAGAVLLIFYFSGLLTRTYFDNYSRLPRQIHPFRRNQNRKLLAIVNMTAMVRG